MSFGAFGAGAPVGGAFACPVCIPGVSGIPAFAGYNPFFGLPGPVGPMGPLPGYNPYFGPVPPFNPAFGTVGPIPGFNPNVGTYPGICTGCV